MVTQLMIWIIQIDKDWQQVFQNFPQMVWSLSVYGDFERQKQEKFSVKKVKAKKI